MTVREVGRVVWRSAPSLEDFLLVAGLASAVYGVQLMHQPSGYLAAGAGLVALAIVYARGRGK